MLKTLTRFCFFLFIFVCFQSMQAEEPPQVRELLSEAIEQRDSAQVKYIMQTHQLPVDSLSIYSQTPLMEAAYHGDLSSVTYLIEKGANVNFKNKSILRNTTPLEHATDNFWRKGDNLVGDIVQALINAGADINAPVNSRPTPFMDACAEKAVKTVNIFISSGIELDRCTSEGKTALMFAIDKNSDEIASILIENGANLEIKNKEGETAIFYAIRKNSPYLLSTLLQGGANINVRDSKGTLPFMHALALKDLNPCIKETLFELTNDFKVVNYDNQSLLSFVARTSDIQTATFLLSIGLNINQKSRKDGSTPFLEAVAANQIEMAKFLVESGANPLSQYHQGISAVYHAAKNGNLELLRFLVDKSVPIDTPDSYGLTPLMLAIINNRIDAVEYLISVGANLNAKTTSSVNISIMHNYSFKQYRLPSRSTPLEISNILNRNKITELLR